MAQWLDRIKYGSGKNGSPAVSGTINTYAACTGTATQTSLTTALAASAGDCILIHQSQGTGAGQWELNYVLADAGATLTLAYPLAYTYGTGAQAVLVPQYTGGTLSGAVTGTAWNGTVGGIIALMSNGDLNLSGSVSAYGIGFRGGNGNSGQNQATSGEGYLGAGSATTNANGVSGGGSVGDDCFGAAGGYGTAGGTGAYKQNGTSGGTNGIADLTTLFFGGAGGGAADFSGTAGGRGGDSGGIVLIFAKNITITGTINVNGKSGNVSGDTSLTAGGGAAGGSCLIKCQTANLGSNKITSTGGVAVNAFDGRMSAAGGVGRIHIDYADSYTGTTTPTIDAAQVTTLKSQIYGSMI